ncbi:hypothetical protein [Mesorhizobium sp. L103C131B0]|uniref:hypothetical protein n=1 Tax=Mesorhizobium sp. L103C131B0 TaxID=1287089 RepID=UPI0018C96528
MAAKRLRVGVLFGGRSAEHEVSLLSATMSCVLWIGEIRLVPTFVTREGQWLLSDFKDGALATPSDGTQLCLPPGGHGGCWRSRQGRRMTCLPSNMVFRCCTPAWRGRRGGWCASGGHDAGADS